MVDGLLSPYEPNEDVIDFAFMMENSSLVDGDVEREDFACCGFWLLKEALVPSGDADIFNCWANACAAALVDGVVNEKLSLPK